MNEEIRQLEISVSVSEEDLIVAAKPFFKGRGFKKKNKRWTKITEDFELSFLIQSSQLKPLYYVCAGVYLNAFEKGVDYYGHFHVDIPITTVDEILDSADAFFKEWTDRPLIKERVLAFMASDDPLYYERKIPSSDHHEIDTSSYHVLCWTRNLHRDILYHIADTY